MTGGAAALCYLDGVKVTRYLETKVPEMGNRYLPVILLPDGETVHNAFFDRDFVP